MTQTTGTATGKAVGAGSKGGLVLKDGQGTLYFVRVQLDESDVIAPQDSEEMGADRGVGHDG
ncbi:hypothetical protein [Actinomadura oligospora]|uniref:hypothetical protein n=1 Tax=Actinomadura oligospora TaxID=111804 RepID=UPI0012F89D1F|nr:hypothetical protein [Actinomadura oligospora]